MARVFISYASDDRVPATLLHDRLTSHGHEVFLDHDLRDGIAVGDSWQGRLHERLRWADAVIPLISTRYVTSVWCAAELGIAISRGTRVLPVRVDPGVTHPLLDGIQYAEPTGDGLEVALRRLETVGGSGWHDGRSPFPGLRAFDVDYHRVFFGRASETAQLVSRLRSPAERADGAVLLIVGPSGCGKSSLVRAGLVPAVGAEPGWWVLPPIVPGHDPVAALVSSLARAGRRSRLDWTIKDVRTRLDSVGGLREVADELLLAAPARRLLVVVDQLEELLTQTPEASRVRFARLLRPALTGPLQVVGTIRPEYLDELLADEALHALPVHTFPLRPLVHDALRSVVEGPLRIAGIDIDDDLTARLISDTGTGDALPLLAFTLAELADGVARGGRLSAARYDELGGVRGALARQADAALAEAQGQGSTEDDVLRELLRLVTLDHDGRPARRRAPRDDASATGLDAFVSRRLLTADIDPETGLATLSIAHEAFLSAWPPLAAAIGDAKAGLRAARAVEQAAAEWVEAGRAPNRLWERGRLAAAVADTGRRSHMIVLSPGARQFLRAGVRRDRLRRGRAFVVLSVLLTLAVGAATVAFIQRSQARGQQRAAVARELALQADKLRATRPTLSLRLAIAATSLSPDVTLTAALTGAYPAGTLPARADEIPSEIAFSPAGNRIVVTRAETVEIWDITDPSHPRRVAVVRAQADAVAYGGGGRILAIAEERGVSLWSMADDGPRRRGQLSGAWTGMLFTADGRTVATLGEDGDARLWDVGEAGRPRRLAGIPVGSVEDADISADGRFLATAESFQVEPAGDGRARLWDIADPEHVRRVAELESGDTFGVDVSPNGRIVATISLPGDVLAHGVLWDVTDPARPREAAVLPVGDVNDMAFSPVGHSLATDAGAGESLVILWNLDQLRAPRRAATLDLQSGSVMEIDWAVDGRLLGVSMADGSVRLWNLAPAAAAASDPVGEACRIAGGGLTPEQWANSVPDFPYQRSCPPG